MIPFGMSAQPAQCSAKMESGQRLPRNQCVTKDQRSCATIAVLFGAAAKGSPVNANLSRKKTKQLSNSLTVHFSFPCTPLLCIPLPLQALPCNFRAFVSGTSVASSSRSGDLSFLPTAGCGSIQHFELSSRVVVALSELNWPFCHTDNKTTMRRNILILTREEELNVKLG